MTNTAFLIILQQIIVIVVAQSQLIFDRIDLGDNSCFTVQNGIYVNGSCLTIGNCPSVLSNVLKQIYDHTVCGYDGTTQIVCCPTEVRQLQKMEINLYQNLECQMANSNEIGVIKFVSECPALNISGTVAADRLDKICDFEVCSDLVCCPVQHKNRLKKVCSKVDDPTDTLQLRLLRNQECTIKELNIKGIYQTRCDFAERNPHLAPLLRNVCNDVTCTGWYCCPIENVDKLVCTKHEISSSIAIFVGPKCLDSRTGRNGTCKTIWDCPQSRGSSSTLDKCGTHCCDDYYCCPDIELVNLSLSAQACLSYTNYLQKEIIEVPMDSDINKTLCFSPGAGAAGGILTRPGDFPHMAALGYESEGQEILWNCGGSLISDRYVLTAAHCISIRAGPVKRVRLGVVDLLNDVNTPDCPEEYNVIRQITHPDYTSRLVYNDIGLIELDGQVKFNFHIRPLCLPISSDIPNEFTSMGWGAIGPTTDEKSVKLLLVYQTLFSHEECDEFYRLYVNRKINQGVLNETQICAGSRSSIQSTCTGDSGGPLLGQQSKYYGLFDIYGVVSFGTACGFANTPGIYTKVYPYMKWIEGIVFNN